MAEKPKKTVAITIRRERRTIPKTVVMTGFKLRPDKVTGLLDVYLESAGGQKGERVSLDPIVLGENLAVLKRYVAGLAVEPDDSSQKDEVLVSEQSHFSNLVNCSNMGQRSETTFGVFSMSDWVEASRSENKNPEIMSFDNVVAISTAAVQKKLILEIVLILSPANKQ